MTIDSSTRFVKAIHSYKGSHNDELTLELGDIITVTQVVEGGWCEGTLADLTGWFPSSYVQEVKVLNDQTSTSASPSTTDPYNNTGEATNYYHGVVLNNIIDSEKAFIVEVQNLLQLKLKIIGSSGILSVAEYNYLHGNLEDLCQLHINLLASFDECLQATVGNQRIGRVFMNAASSVRRVYIDYYGNHPRAVNVLLNKKEELIKLLSPTDSPSDPKDNSAVITLTSELAAPFSRLERYPLLLKELERHTEKSHVDRGDTQRAKTVYSDILDSANAMRNQKELEYDVMQCDIQGLHGEKLSSLGGLIRVSHVLLFAKENLQSSDRLFLLFPGVLVILQFNDSHSGYVFEQKYNVSGLSSSALSDCDTYSNAFSLNVPNQSETPIIACCSPSECQEWMSLLNSHAHHSHHQHHQLSSTPTVATTPINTSTAPRKPHNPSSFSHTLKPKSNTPKHTSSSSSSSSSHQKTSSSSTLPRKVMSRISLRTTVTPSIAPSTTSTTSSTTTSANRNSCVTSSSSSCSTTPSSAVKSSSPPRMKTCSTSSATDTTTTGHQPSNGAPPLPRVDSARSHRSVTGNKGSPDYRNQQVWLQSCLRPSAPLHPAFRDAGQSGNNGRTSQLTNAARRKTVDENNMDSGSYLLKVIEAYCFKSDPNIRKTIHSVDLSKLSKRRSNAVGEINRSYSTEEKPLDLLYGIHNNQSDNNSYLMDIIHRLKDQVRDVKMEQGKLRTQMQSEVVQRKKLEAFVKKNVMSINSNNPANIYST